VVVESSTVSVELLKRKNGATRTTSATMMSMKAMTKTASASMKATT
jgi:hypothetical protein